MVFVVGILLCLAVSPAVSQPGAVEVRNMAAEKKVEIHVGGRLFTAYCYGPSFELKPVFYPVLNPIGKAVNREIPFSDEELRKSQDHFHHQSLFLGYGDIDGHDFWTGRNGERIRHQAILGMSSGETGRLEVLLAWLDPQGQVTVNEVRRVSFGGGEDLAWMDHDITLTAPDEPRSFNDTKEGMFAIRVADELREDEGSGAYLNAYGWEGADEIWGKRSPWVALLGQVEGHDVTVAIFGHPTSENHPSYWHARAYGLFSVNPFGRKDFVRDSEPENRRLGPFESFHFRYKVVVYDGRVAKSRIDEDYWEYVK
jgi:hypothetical protein